MKFLIALLITISSVLGGYVLANGKLGVLWQPFEVLMIFGGALGIFIMSNTGTTLKETTAQFKFLLVPPVNKKKFVQTVQVLDALTNCYFRDGGKALETHLDDPASSEYFSKAPALIKDKKAVKFISDNFRLVTNNDFVSHELSEYLDDEIEQYHHAMSGPAHALNELGDTMPGLGIVVAVLGIIISMGHIDGDPAELGYYISAALFGTFIGIFAGYGLFKPVATYLGNMANEHVELYKVMKFYIVALSDQDKAPMVIMEISHKFIPPHYKVTLDELKGAQ